MSLRRVALVSAISVPAVLALGCGSGASQSAGRAADTSASKPDGAAVDAGADAGTVAGYTVMGPFVYDASGEKHLFRGVDRPSLEWSSNGSNLAQLDYDTMKAWGANVVRIPLNQDFWLSDPSNPNYDSNYADVVDEQVQWAEGDGLDVILDLHWSDAGSFAQSPGQWCMADQNSITFWQQVAAKYKNDPHVLFELYNEPYIGSWSVWLNGGTATCTSYQNHGGQNVSFNANFQVAGMQQLYDAVRSTGAQNLVVVGGISYAFDLSGVGKGYRVKDANGQPAPNVIYNTHPYDTPDKSTPAQWYSAFGYLAATDPVIATEFGDATPATCATAMYDSSIIPYFDGVADSGGDAGVPANRISWTAWAFYPGGCTFPSLLTDDYDTTPSGAVVEAALQSFQQ